MSTLRVQIMIESFKLRPIYIYHAIRFTPARPNRSRNSSTQIHINHGRREKSSRGRAEPPEPPKHMKQVQLLKCLISCFVRYRAVDTAYESGGRTFEEPRPISLVLMCFTLLFLSTNLITFYIILHEGKRERYIFRR